MPHGVKKSGSGYAIVRKDTGQVKGKSKSKKNAAISAWIRDKAAHDPSFRPKKKR